MNELLSHTLDHLERLVSFDTRNPPRAIAAEGGIFDYIRGQLPGFEVEVIDHGAGAVSLFAVRGAPSVLFNVHLDTVPDSPDWSADPHTMRRFDDRVVGLGVCDIKGAAAALIAAANADGQITAVERQRILGKLDEAGADVEDRRIVEQELQQPRSLDALLRDVTDPETAEQVYLASEMAIDAGSPAEKSYLQYLAARLNLPEDRVQEMNRIV